MLLDRLLHGKVFARIFSFVESGGFYAGRAFLDWIVEKLGAKGIAAGDTFEDFNRKTGADLSLVASDTTDMEMLVLNHRTAPRVPVAWAVRMSMSIPFVWQEVVWREEWGAYLGRAKTGNVLVDGGCLSNFPIRLIAETDETIREVMGDTDPNGALNLGLLIDETRPVPGAPDTPKTPTGISSLKTVQRVSRLLDTLTGAADNEMIRRRAAEICRLPAKGYGTLEFGMEGERLELFLQAARDAMNRHLAGRQL
jgi:predicted acylesterase/phospholipase RssA